MICAAAAPPKTTTGQCPRFVIVDVALLTSSTGRPLTSDEMSSFPIKWCRGEILRDYLRLVIHRLHPHMFCALCFSCACRLSLTPTHVGLHYACLVTETADEGSCFVRYGLQTVRTEAECRHRHLSLRHSATDIGANLTYMRRMCVEAS